MVNYLCFDIEEHKLDHRGMAGGALQGKFFWEKYESNREFLYQQDLMIKRKDS